MKRKTTQYLIALLGAAAIFVVSCTKDTSNVTLDPKLTTSDVQNITSDSATVLGFVVAGSEGFTERGVCYRTDTVAEPSITDSKTVYTGTLTTATFPVVLSQLHYATTYYARAYATNSGGTLYGKRITFTTKAILPTVTTASVTDVTGTSAKAGGSITNDGGAAITARGMVFGTEANPTLANGKTIDGTGAGDFVSNITGLTGLTKYYARAYATNAIGTSYGQEVTFTTLVSIRNWYVPGNYVGASYPGLGMNDWDPATSPMVKSTAADPDKVQGYVYMANSSNEWKIATQPNWNGTNYGSSVAGQLDPAGGNIVSPGGYYKIDINPNTLAYTAVSTAWGVIGSATANGWNDETALAYVPQTKLWSGGMHLNVGEIKFRANHNWDYNYGSTAGNATLDAGGSNIPIATAADYFIELNLSSPWNYTYTAHYWGLIGSATPDGWNSDQNMTWDGSAMTITLNLSVGEIKFRADDAWTFNYGGDINALTNGGANIPISTAGNYTIKLFLSGATPHCTITKN